MWLNCVLVLVATRLATLHTDTLVFTCCGAAETPAMVWSRRGGMTTASPNTCSAHLQSPPLCPCHHDQHHCLRIVVISSGRCASGGCCAVWQVVVASQCLRHLKQCVGTKHTMTQTQQPPTMHKTRRLLLVSNVQAKQHSRLCQCDTLCSSCTVGLSVFAMESE